MTIVDYKQYYDKLDALFRQQAVTMSYFDETDGKTCREELDRLSKMIQELQTDMQHHLISLGYGYDFSECMVHAFDHKSLQYYEEINESRRRNYGTDHH